MGYRMNTVRSTIEIPHSKREKALKAANQKIDEDYDTLENLCRKHKMSVRSDDEGNFRITAIRGKIGFGKETILHAIAPYVKTDTYIEMSGEDGARWRWYFHENEMEEQNPEITY